MATAFCFTRGTCWSETSLSEPAEKQADLARRRSRWGVQVSKGGLDCTNERRRGNIEELGSAPR